MSEETLMRTYYGPQPCVSFKGKVFVKDEPRPVNEALAYACDTHPGFNLALRRKALEAEIAGLEQQVQAAIVKTKEMQDRTKELIAEKKALIKRLESGDVNEH